MNIKNSFPGYELVREIGIDGKSKILNKYRDIDIGMGGYVYANYGIYHNVALLDVASMHPTSLILLNYFGKYTSKFKEILDARLLIKHENYDEAKKLLNGKLEKYLNDKAQADKLAYALKIVLNSQYGLTSAKFDMPQRDIRNVNNIVALRGALFMKTLQDEVSSKGYTIIHIKTDSIKIANADNDIINFCFDFGKQYGYTFEHEATMEKICLITDADYIAKYSWAQKKKDIGKWKAVGAQFSHPFIFKKLFSKEDLVFKDFCEVRNVKTALYLDMNENLEDGEHNYHFIGRVGEFCPIQKGKGGGELVSERGEKYNAVTGTKGYRWLESEVVKNENKINNIDFSYFTSKVDDIVLKIKQYEHYEEFLNNI